MIQSQKVEDTSLASAAPMMVSRWMVWIAANEIERITATCRCCREQGKPVPAGVWAGMDERFR